MSVAVSKIQEVRRFLTSSEDKLTRLLKFVSSTVSNEELVSKYFIGNRKKDLVTLKKYLNDYGLVGCIPSDFKSKMQEERVKKLIKPELSTSFLTLHTKLQEAKIESDVDLVISEVSRLQKEVEDYNSLK